MTGANPSLKKQILTGLLVGVLVPVPAAALVFNLVGGHGHECVRVYAAWLVLGAGTLTVLRTKQLL